MGFENLPVELILAIGARSNSIQDLLSLVKTSRGFYNILQEALIAYNVEHNHSRGLHRATMLNNRPIIKQFIAHPGTDLEVRGMTREQVNALTQEQVDKIRRSIHNHFSSEFKLICTPLCLAIYLDYEDIACLLLDSGANPNAAFCQWQFFPTALTLAVTMKQEKCVRKLLEKGATYEIHPPYYHRSLVIQASQDKSLGILECLLNEIALDFPTSFQYHLDEALVISARDGYLEAVTMLLKRGANANSTITSWSALYMAIVSSSDEVVIFLLQNGADIAYDLGQLEQACRGLRRDMRPIPLLPRTTIIEALRRTCKALRDDGQRAAVHAVLEKALSFA
ncbi:ankyrin repeat-containing domain protein [Aspergillus californicus]